MLDCFDNCAEAYPNDNQHVRIDSYIHEAKA